MFAEINFAILGVIPRNTIFSKVFKNYPKFGNFRAKLAYFWIENPSICEIKFCEDFFAQKFLPLRRQSQISSFRVISGLKNESVSRSAKILVEILALLLAQCLPFCYIAFSALSDQNSTHHMFAGLMWFQIMTFEL